MVTDVDDAVSLQQDDTIATDQFRILLRNLPLGDRDVQIGFVGWLKGPGNTSVFKRRYDAIKRLSLPALGNPCKPLRVL